MPRAPEVPSALPDVIGAAVMVAKIATGEIEDNRWCKPERAPQP
jgi:hypothetical protein